MKKLLLLSLLCYIIFSVSPLHAQQPSSWEQTFPDGLITSSGEAYDVDKLAEKKLIALYFTAGWCRGCRTLTPLLIPFLKANEETLEIVMVNFDDSKKDMMDYMTEYPMPWPAIDFGTSAIQTLKERFKVSEIPALIIFNTNGRVLTEDGYNQFDLEPDTCVSHWLKLAEQK